MNRRDPTGKGNYRRNALHIFRGIVFILGIVAVAGAAVLWLYPVSPGKTTVSENTTTKAIDGAGQKNTTAVKKTTATTTPGVARSDVMLVAVLTFGVGLLVVACLWDQMKEITVGGLSFKLAETAVADPEVAPVDAAAMHASVVCATSCDQIVNKVAEICKGRFGLVHVDLRRDTEEYLWAPTNLSLFMLLLAGRSLAKVVVFTDHGFAGPQRYIGAASVEQLAYRLAARDPDLSAAYLTTEAMQLQTTPPAESLGQKFIRVLTWRDPTRTKKNEKVDQERLETLAGNTLINDSVVSDGEQTLSKEEQRSILLFPLSYVPITCRGNLSQIIDREKFAEKLAFSLVRP
jgi:hypothetical protein